MFTDNIKPTVESFFLCTHIPIKAIGTDGALLHHSGYTDKLEELFPQNYIYKTIIDEAIKNDKNHYITIKPLDGITFTACHICSCCKDKGFFIFGPYTCDKERVTIDIVYKPYCCISPLVSLLYGIKDGITSTTIKKPETHSNYSYYVENSIKHICDNFHKPITLESTAKCIKVNKCYLCTIFKKETGKTYSKFLNHIRIEKSKELLVNSNLSILEISLSVGFNNQNYFNTIFKKLTNKTPLEYRNENLISKD
jgi:AraC-like DNA-binding protein